jgi:hypothetical protein
MELPPAQTGPRWLHGRHFALQLVEKSLGSVTVVRHYGGSSVEQQDLVRDPLQRQAMFVGLNGKNVVRLHGQSLHPEIGRGRPAPMEPTPQPLASPRLSAPEVVWMPLADSWSEGIETRVTGRAGFTFG